jgi:hypothetical protein
MTILNWLYLKKQQLIKTEVNDAATDLILLGAQVPFTTRDDGYQDYAMTVQDFTDQLNLDRLTAGTRELVLDDTGNLTLNTGDLTIQTDPLLGNDIVIRATNIVQIEGGTGILNDENNGGDAYFNAGDGSDSDGAADAGDGGNVVVYAGDAGNSASGTQAVGGFVEISGGYTSLAATAGGSVTIYGGYSVGSIEGSVVIGNINAFTFDPNSATLTFPAIGLANLGLASALPGARAIINDSTVAASTNFGAIAVNGGANIVPVFSDGTNWLIG